MKTTIYHKCVRGIFSKKYFLMLENKHGDLFEKGVCEREWFRYKIGDKYVIDGSQRTNKLKQ